MKQYVITDIHGCCQTFKNLLKKIQFSKEDELYLLGDYIDRGPDSKGVIDHIWHLQKNGYKVHCLKGNHEQMMLNAFKFNRTGEHWMYDGLASIPDDYDYAEGKIPHEYLTWMDSLPTYLELGKFILVHAGLNFNLLDPFEGVDSHLWIRDWYGTIDHECLGDRYIIHGHTPLMTDDIVRMRDQLEDDRVLNLDGGCVFDRPGLGYLVAYELGSGELVFERKEEGLKIRLKIY